VIATRYDKALNFTFLYAYLYMPVNTVRCVNWQSSYLTLTRYATDRPKKGFCANHFYNVLTPVRDSYATDT